MTPPQLARLASRVLREVARVFGAEAVATTTERPRRDRNRIVRDYCGRPVMGYALDVEVHGQTYPVTARMWPRRGGGGGAYVMMLREAQWLLTRQESNTPEQLIWKGRDAERAERGSPGFNEAAR